MSSNSQSRSRRVLHRAMLAILCLAACSGIDDQFVGDSSGESRAGDAPSGDVALDASVLDNRADELVDPVPDVGDVSHELDGRIDAERSDIVDASEDSTPDSVDPPGSETPRYALGQRHSPLTPEVVEGLRAIASVGDHTHVDRFILVGDSITADNHFFECFTSDALTLPERPELEETYAFFRGAEDVPNGPLFERQGYAVLGGKNARWEMTVDARGANPVCSTTTPLLCEIDAVAPHLAIVMLGTNDIGWYVHQGRVDEVVESLRNWGRAYIPMLDAMTERGIVPIVTTIPPKTSSELIDGYIMTVNLLIRAMAEYKRLPLIDYHSELLALGEPYGLWSDGVHPRFRGRDGCDLSEVGLEGGINIRNLISLEGLDRTRRVLAGGAAPDEEHGPQLSGDGSLASPFEIDALPFWHAADTATWPHAQLDRYPECDTNDQDESGPELVYRLETDRPLPLRIAVVDGDGTDVDLHVLREHADVDRCVARHDTMIEGTLSPGVTFVVADTFVSSSGDAFVGEFAIAIHECEPDETQCEDPL